MGFLEKMADVIEDIKTDKEQNAGLLDELKETFKQTDIGSTIEDFKQKGLGDTILSWVSVDENKPITREQVKDIFSTKLKNLSEKSGISENDIPDHLSNLLPDIINKCTPDGKIED